MDNKKGIFLNRSIMKKFKLIQIVFIFIIISLTGGFLIAEQLIMEIYGKLLRLRELLILQ